MNSEASLLWEWRFSVSGKKDLVLHLRASHTPKFQNCFSRAQLSWKSLILERKSCQVAYSISVGSSNSWRETLRQTPYFKGELVCRAGKESGHVNLHAKQTT